MHERIKKIRNELKLTQQEFADKLGTPRGNIAGYEVGRQSPSNAAISLICEKFNVNEGWLRTGEGDMFLQISKENQLMQWAAKILRDESDSFRRRFVSMLMELDESDWETLAKVSEKLHKKES